MAGKSMISIRLNQDVLDWFRREFPDGYQKGINSVLEQFRNDAIARQYINLGRVQELYRQFHTRCFWHRPLDLIISPEFIPMVQEGLRIHGGREGFLLAAEIDSKVYNHANN